MKLNAVNYMGLHGLDILFFLGPFLVQIPFSSLGSCQFPQSHYRRRQIIGQCVPLAGEGESAGWAWNLPMAYGLDLKDGGYGWREQGKQK